MNDLLKSSKLSIEHAKRRVRELEREMRTFLDSNPYTTVIEQNADGTEDFHKVKLVNPMPVSLPFIAFDAVTSLRASLDQAGYAIAVAAGKSGNKAHFPFGDCLKNAQGAANGGSRDLPKEIFDLMISFQPYKGGNDLLWALNEVCNSHKHEIVTPIAIYTGSAHVKEIEMEFPRSFSFPPVWDGAKNEMIFGHVRHGAKFQYDFQLVTCIAFKDVQVISREPADGVLNKFISMVSSIIVQLTEKSRAMGLSHD